MAIRYAIGDALVTERELTEKRLAGSLTKLGHALKVGESHTLSFDNGDATHDNVITSYPSDTADGVPVSHVSFAIGTPLSVTIRHVYTGKHPVKHFLAGRQDLLITSSMKGIEVYEGSPRAVNFLVRDCDPRKDFRWTSASAEGTNLVYYSPSLTGLSSILTLSVAFDRFPDEFFDMTAGFLGGAAKLPIFVPASGYILAAGAVVQLAKGVGQYFIESSPVLEVTEALSLDWPGDIPTAAGFILMMSSEAVCRSVEREYRINSYGCLARIDDPNRAYDGDHPYVVISLDGRKRPAFESFVPHAATAEMLEQFYGTRSNTAKVGELALEAMTLVNDFKFRQKADRLAKELDAIADKSSDEYLAKKALREAAIENIRSVELRP